MKFVTASTTSQIATSAVVSWTSNETARGAVRYGLTAALGDSVTTAPGTSGSATLPGLTRGTTYHYRVAITDLTNLTTLSAPATFATLANRAPVAAASGNPLTGPPPLAVQFSSAGSSDPDGDALAIREERDASEVERAIRECNAGLYAVDLGVLRAELPRLRRANAQGEMYLTDLVAARARIAEVATLAIDAMEAAGVNTIDQLEALERG